MTDNLFYVLQLMDVNEPTIQCFGRTWLVANFLGRVLPCDVGKQVKAARFAHQRRRLIMNPESTPPTEKDDLETCRANR